jgi:hypothetical protein
MIAQVLPATPIMSRPAVQDLIDQLQLGPSAESGPQPSQDIIAQTLPATPIMSRPAVQDLIDQLQLGPSAESGPQPSQDMRGQPVVEAPPEEAVAAEDAAAIAEEEADARAYMATRERPAKPDVPADKKWESVSDARKMYGMHPDLMFNLAIDFYTTMGSTVTTNYERKKGFPKRENVKIKDVAPNIQVFKTKYKTDPEFAIAVIRKMSQNRNWNALGRIPDLE